MNPSQLIAFLNSINIGALEGIQGKLDQASTACRNLDQQELAELLSEAGTSLGRADMKTYRKRIATVVARLGHLR